MGFGGLGLPHSLYLFMMQHHSRKTSWEKVKPRVQFRCQVVKLNVKWRLKTSTFEPFKRFKTSFLNFMATFKINLKIVFTAPIG